MFQKTVLYIVVGLLLSAAFSSQSAFKRHRRDVTEVSSQIDDIVGRLESLSANTDSLKNALEGVKASVESKPSMVTKVSGVVSSVGTSLKKFASGDAFQIASGCLDIIASVASTFGGPYGIAVGSVASLISSVISIFTGKSMGNAVKTVIEDAFRRYRDQELEDSVSGAKRTFDDVIVFVNRMSESTNLTEVQLNHISNAVGPDTFSNMLGILESRIGRGSVSQDTGEAQRTITFVHLYLQLSVMREALLTQVILLYKRVGGAYDDIAYSLAGTNDQNKEATRETITFLHQIEPKHSLCGSFYYPIDHSNLTQGIRSLAGYFGVPEPRRYSFDGSHYRIENRYWSRYSICRESYMGNSMFRSCKDVSYPNIQINKLDNGYHTIRLRSRYLYITRHAQGWGWGTAVDDPGEQGYFTFVPLTSGYYMMSSKKWKDYFVYMESSAHGYIRSWKNNPGPQGHWKIL